MTLVFTMIIYNYNTYTNDNIARQGLMNSFIQSQQIKPNELINDNPIMNNRDGFEKENTYNEKP